MILYHGSVKNIEKPQYGEGKVYNDFGKGFYCTESEELAKEWACPEEKDGFANCYQFDASGLRVLNLTTEPYHILHWLTQLVTFRNFSLNTPIMRQGAEWLKEHFFVDVNEYDVIIGYRADDSYFSFAKAFLNNSISLEQLAYAMQLGKLGEQVVIKSEKAFSRLQFCGYSIAEQSIYFGKRKRRDEEARWAYFSSLEESGISGKYLRDLIIGGVADVFL